MSGSPVFDAYTSISRDGSLALKCHLMSKKRHPYFDSRLYHVRTATVSEYPHGHLLKTHWHPWHQLLYASAGVMTVRTREGGWMVPPHRGVWIPAHLRHSVLMSGAVSMRTLYLAPRSEEHTSELQSPVQLVCRLLLEKIKDA